ncbi:pleiotropic drug resistance protein 1 [Helianthus annuus]|uniref:pleiotropic drug resistance protein 1 n=1 Tax=Helianthus annuus TaxID=4232 RepID=UPI000B90441E|nr:pleiotropic drug resistance protein 1 [Helianthus annuus]
MNKVWDTCRVVVQPHLIFGGKILDLSNASFFLIIQCIACLWKQRLSYWRNPPYTAVRFAFTTFIGVMFGTMFWDLGSKKTTQRDLNNAMGSMYAAVLFLSIQNASAVQPVVDVERTVFYRERAAGMYSALPYAFAQILVEIPYIFSQTIVYSVIVYAMIGFDWTVAKFCWYVFFQFCSLLYMTYYGMMTVAITPNANIAAIIAASFYGIFNLFSGFIIPRPRIPVWWRWYYWGNPLAWTIYGMVASQFGDFDDVLTSEETVKGYLDRYYGYKHSFLGPVAGVHVGLILFFGFIFAYCIRAFNFQKR